MRHPEKTLIRNNVRIFYFLFKCILIIIVVCSKTHYFKDKTKKCWRGFPLFQYNPPPKKKTLTKKY